MTNTFIKNFLAVLLFSPFFLIGQRPINMVENMIANKQFKEAEKLLISYIEENTNDLEAIELLGDTYGHQKKWDEAILYYKQLVEAKSTVANFHYKYGGALGMKALSISKFKALGIIGDVKDAFLKAAELDPNHIESRWALVELYMQLPSLVGGSKVKSFKYANELENLAKVDGYLAKGYIYEYDDEPKLAEKFYRKALNEKGYLNCCDMLITICQNEDQSLKTLSKFQTAKVEHERNGLHYQIGKVCADYILQLEKGILALKVYIYNYSARDGVPKAWAYYRLAQIYKHKKDKEEATIWIDKAIADLPKIDVFKEFKVAIENLKVN